MSKKGVLQFTGIGFILSTIGGAIGLGNIWRFPQQMVSNGGSTFIIVYFLVILLVVFPIFLLELNFGVFFRKGVVKCFGKNNRFFGKGTGWEQVILLAFMGIYYTLIIAWVGVAFVLSFIPELFDTWGSKEHYKTWFSKEIIREGSVDKIKSVGDIAFSPWVLISVFVILIIILVISSLGVRKGLERANYIFVPGLFVMVIGLTIYATFFFSKDAKLGMHALFDFDFSKVMNPYVWSQAVKQAVFSTGILLGILIVFSKNADVRMDKGNEAVLVILADTFVALVAGLLVVSLVSHQEGLEWDKTYGAKNIDILERNKQVVNQIKAKFDSNDAGGTNLVFVYLPRLFQGINASHGTNFGLGNAFMVIFFLTLLFAALSSIIAMVEVFVDSMRENFGLTQSEALFAWAFPALMFLFLYSTSIGGSLLGDQDNIIIGALVVIGLIEVVIFLFSSSYREVLQTNDRYTFLKLSRFNWLKIILCTITVPILFLVSLFGVLEITGVNHILAQKSWMSWLNLDVQKSQAFKMNWVQIISLSMFGLTFLITSVLTLMSYKKRHKIALKR